MDQVLGYLVAHDHRAFKAREIASQIGVDEGAVSTALSRLKIRTLVEQKATYWAVTGDTERLEGYGGYERATALFNQRVSEAWKEETTPFERVYEVLEQTHDGQSAAEITERALVSEPTARRHLNALVATGFGATSQDGRTTRYRRDEDRVLQTRIRELRHEASRDETLDGIRRMKAAIREYENEYDALSPEELARQLPTDATGEWEDVTAWKTTRQNLAVAQAALAYDEASEQLTA